MWWFLVSQKPPEESAVTTFSISTVLYLYFVYLFPQYYFPFVRKVKWHISTFDMIITKSNWRDDLYFNGREFSKFCTKLYCLVDLQISISCSLSLHWKNQNAEKNSSEMVPCLQWKLFNNCKLVSLGALLRGIFAKRELHPV